MSTLREYFSGFSLARRRNRPGDDVPQQIYGGLVAQSRLAAFYMRYGIADTVTGRFDMLCLHVFLFSHRLTGETGPIARSFSQEVFDCFVDDIDRALRELGIGDNTVPKRKKRLIRGFYAQIDAFAGPLDNGDAATLAAAVGKRFFGDPASPDADLLSDYMLKADRALAAIAFDDLIAGQMNWPDPDRIL
ncbi:MAG: ubiquinol-cytochrome C chaperone [Salaquimonas sp.]|jgi:cytochrome b pre-mRNA-processing protein 3|nr:ubiquinol-cytochrome C chaperone [Salaquimonas sp.]